MTWLKETWRLARESVMGFIADEALSHSAAMAFYSVTALAPILLIVVAIAGLGFGHDAAAIAVTAQLSGLMGPESADLLRTAIEGASGEAAGTWATIVGLVTLFITASGVFGEMQLALNKIWKVPPAATSLSALVRARAASLGLVAALGFLLLASLVASAAISALSDTITANLPLGTAILAAINGFVSFLLIALLFAAIYKVLPDRSLQWRDVAIGAIATSLLFTVGKSLIGWYIGQAAGASSYGAAGAFLVLLLWVYYSAVIFLLGAEFTRAYSVRQGSRPDLSGVVDVPAEGEKPAAPPRTAILQPDTAVLLAAVAGLAVLSLVAERRDRSA